MIAKIKKDGEKIGGEIIINGCNECMFCDKSNWGKNKWYCQLLDEIIDKLPNTEHYYKCPLKIYHKVEVNYVLHSYSESVRRKR